MTTRLLPRPGRDLLRVVAGAAALTGFAVAAMAIVPRGVIGDGGVGGGDAHAYWVAGRNVLAGAPLYTGASGDLDAYLYPPPFAQALAPVAGVLPAAAFIWLWRAVSLAGLLIAAGSWRAAGIALLVFPPLIVELDTANVHLVLAAICTLVLRGATHALPFAFVLKMAGGGAVPFALHRNWRKVVLGAGVAALVVVISVVLSPGSWVDYAAFLAGGQPTDYWTNLTRDIPLLPRLLVAAFVGLLGIRWPILVPVAFVASMPIVSLNSLAILVCVAPIVAAWAGRVIAGTTGRAQPSAAMASNESTATL